MKNGYKNKDSKLALKSDMVVTTTSVHLLSSQRPRGPPLTQFTETKRSSTYSAHRDLEFSTYSVHRGQDVPPLTQFTETKRSSTYSVHRDLEALHLLSSQRPRGPPLTQFTET
jgi:hypothetical protein